MQRQLEVVSAEGDTTDAGGSSPAKLQPEDARWPFVDLAQSSMPTTAGSPTTFLVPSTPPPTSSPTSFPAPPPKRFNYDFDENSVAGSLSPPWPLANFTLDSKAFCLNKKPKHTCSLGCFGFGIRQIFLWWLFCNFTLSWCSAPAQSASLHTLNVQLGFEALGGLPPLCHQPRRHDELRFILPPPNQRALAFRGDGVLGVSVAPR